MLTQEPWVRDNLNVCGFNVVSACVPGDDDTISSEKVREVLGSNIIVRAVIWAPTTRYGEVLALTTGLKVTWFYFKIYICILEDALDLTLLKEYEWPNQKLESRLSLASHLHPFQRLDGSEQEYQENKLGWFQKGNRARNGIWAPKHISTKAELEKLMRNARKPNPPWWSKNLAEAVREIKNFESRHKKLSQMKTNSGNITRVTKSNSKA